MYVSRITNNSIRQYLTSEQQVETVPFSTYLSENIAQIKVISFNIACLGFFFYLNTPPTAEYYMYPTEIGISVINSETQHVA